MHEIEVVWHNVRASLALFKLSLILQEAMRCLQAALGSTMAPEQAWRAAPAAVLIAHQSAAATAPRCQGAIHPGETPLRCQGAMRLVLLHQTHLRQHPRMRWRLPQMHPLLLPTQQPAQQPDQQ